MQRLKFNNIVSWILLIFFALFIVPPAFCFASSHPNCETAAPQTGTSIVQDRHTAPLLLFDILLWQKLKKTKQSEEVVASFPGYSDRGESWMQAFDESALVHRASDSSRLANPIDHLTLTHQSRSSYIHFSRSGISPPVFFR